MYLAFLWGYVALAVGGALLAALLRNQEETREEEARLSFRRGLILGLRLGALGSAR